MSNLVLDREELALAAAYWACHVRGVAVAKSNVFFADKKGKAVPFLEARIPLDERSYFPDPKGGVKP